MVTRGMSSAMPISSLKCTWTRLSARRLQLGLGCRSIRRARRLPRNLVTGGGHGLSLLVQGRRQSQEGGPSGPPSLHRRELLCSGEASPQSPGRWEESCRGCPRSFLRGPSSPNTPLDCQGPRRAPALLGGCLWDPTQAPERPVGHQDATGQPHLSPLLLAPLRCAQTASFGLRVINISAGSLNTASAQGPSGHCTRRGLLYASCHSQPRQELRAHGLTWHGSAGRPG